MPIRTMLRGLVIAVMLGQAMGLPTPAAAQQTNLNVIVARFAEFYQAGNYPVALIIAQKLESGVKARFGVDHTNYAVAFNNLAIVYYEQGKYADAERFYQRALAIYEAELGSDHPVVAMTLDNLALLRVAVGNPREALVNLVA